MNSGPVVVDRHPEIQGRQDGGEGLGHVSAAEEPDGAGAGDGDRQDAVLEEGSILQIGGQLRGLALGEDPCLRDPLPCQAAEEPEALASAGELHQAAKGGDGRAVSAGSKYWK